MSAITETYIFCDGCSRQFTDSSKTGLTATQQRILATREGWVHTSGEDLCRKCRPRRKDGQIWGSKLKTKRL